MLQYYSTFYTRGNSESKPNAIHSRLKWNRRWFISAQMHQNWVLIRIVEGELIRSKKHSFVLALLERKSIDAFIPPRLRFDALLIVRDKLFQDAYSWARYNWQLISYVTTSVLGKHQLYVLRWHCLHLVYFPQKHSGLTCKDFGFLRNFLAFFSLLVVHNCLAIIQRINYFRQPAIYLQKTRNINTSLFGSTLFTLGSSGNIGPRFSWGSLY